MKLFTTTFLTSTVLAAGTTFAATTVYNDVASFNTALPGGTSTLETFDAETPRLFTEGTATNFDGFSLKYDDVTGSSQRAGIYTAQEVNRASGTAIGNTNQLAWGEYLPSTGNFQSGGDGPDVTFTFFMPITAFAFDFSDSDVTDSYSVKIGNESPFALTSPTGAREFQTFVGFVSTAAFTTIVFSQTATGGATETFSVDNIRTNGVSAPSPVPLPAGLPLLLAGLGAFGVARRMKAKKAA